MPRSEKPKAFIGVPQTPVHSIEVRGRVRTFAVYHPQLNQDEKVPLVMVLHGGLSNSDYAARMSGMNAKADRENFIAVYPNGSGEPGAKALTWNAWNCCGYAAEHRIDDAAFISAMIDKLAAEFPVNLKKVYASGFSNGAMMCHRIAAEIGDKIAAIAPVAGSLNAELSPGGAPVSVMIIHGRDDQHVQIAGGVPARTFAPSNRVDKPLEHAVSYWVKRNGCGLTAREEVRGKLHQRIYSGGKNSTEVAVCLIEGQGHSWPGSVQGLHYGNIDAPVQDVSATDLMWDFFKRHEK